MNTLVAVISSGRIMDTYFPFIYFLLLYFPIFQHCHKHRQKIDSDLGLRMLVPWTGNEKQEWGHHISVLSLHPPSAPT